MEYSDVVKARMVRRMLGPNGVSATALEAETGIPQPTLSRWLRATASIKGVSRTKPSTTPTTPPAPETPATPKRPQDWSAMERAQAVLAASELADEELGEFLRRQGLHREQLDEWRSAFEEALAQPRRSHRPSNDAKRIKELEREIARKDKALAETAALLVLKKRGSSGIAGVPDDGELSATR